jgi:hypothetical protein
MIIRYCANIFKTELSIADNRPQSMDDSPQPLQLVFNFFYFG